MRAREGRKSEMRDRWLWWSEHILLKTVPNEYLKYVYGLWPTDSDCEYYTVSIQMSMRGPTDRSSHVGACNTIDVVRDTSFGSLHIFFAVGALNNIQ